jgi:hypothetical protein
MNDKRMKSPKSDKDEIRRLVNTFLADHRESRGGWAQVTDGDITLLDAIIGKLIDAKSDRDPDNDRTIEYRVINRRQFRGMPFMLVPYEREHEDDEIDGKPKGVSQERLLEIMELNLSIAHDAFKTQFSIWRHRKAEKERESRPPGD